jgi:hypothetical protein
MTEKSNYSDDEIEEAYNNLEAAVKRHDESGLGPDDRVVGFSLADLRIISYGMRKHDAETKPETNDAA